MTQTGNDGKNILLFELFRERNLEAMTNYQRLKLHKINLKRLKRVKINSNIKSHQKFSENFTFNDFSACSVMLRENL